MQYYEDFNLGNTHYGKSSGKEDIFNTSSKAAARYAPGQLLNHGKLKVSKARDLETEADPWAPEYIEGNSNKLDACEIRVKLLNLYDSQLTDYYNKKPTPTQTPTISPTQPYQPTPRPTRARENLTVIANRATIVESLTNSDANTMFKQAFQNALKSR